MTEPKIPMGTIAYRVRLALRRMAKRLDDMRHIEDGPDRFLGNPGRRWRYRPRIGIDRRSLQVGIDIELVQYKGEPVGPRLAQTLTVSIWPFPSDWKVKTEHVYYYGSHCLYSLGPVRFLKMWGKCAKCEGEK